jgi:hypothetical protein
MIERGGRGGGESERERERASEEGNVKERPTIYHRARQAFESPCFVE